jgi:hypothetical protein
MRLRKPKDKTAEFARARQALRDIHARDVPADEGPEVVPIEDVAPWGYVRVKNGVTPWP